MNATILIETTDVKELSAIIDALEKTGVEPEVCTNVIADMESDTCDDVYSLYDNDDLYECTLYGNMPCDGLCHDDVAEKIVSHDDMGVLEKAMEAEAALINYINIHDIDVIEETENGLLLGNVDSGDDELRKLAEGCNSHVVRIANDIIRLIKNNS